jgi:calmodulin
MSVKVNPSQLYSREIERLRKDFEAFDRNQDGLMEQEEFARFLHAVGAHMTEEECRSGFREIDTDQDGVIDFEEFLGWWRPV